MKNRILSATVTATAAILLVAIPRFLLPVCAFAAGSAHGTSPMARRMACYFTAQAETGIAFTLLFAALLLLLSRDAARRLGVTLALLPLPVFIAALPLGLAGVCGGQSSCRVGTLPGLVATAVLLFAFLLGNTWFLSRRKEQIHE